MTRRTVALVCSLVLACLPLGCDSSVSGETAAVETRLKTLAVMYGRYQGAHRGQPPKDRKQLEDFIASLDPTQIPGFGSQTASDLFVSPRDQQPFVVNYGMDAGPPKDAGPMPILAHEAPSEGGEALAVTALGQVSPYVPAGP